MEGKLKITDSWDCCTRLWLVQLHTCRKFSTFIQLRTNASVVIICVSFFHLVVELSFSPGTESASKKKKKNHKKTRKKMCALSQKCLLVRIFRFSAVEESFTTNLCINFCCKENKFKICLLFKCRTICERCPTNQIQIDSDI